MYTRMKKDIYRLCTRMKKAIYSLCTKLKNDHLQAVYQVEKDIYRLCIRLKKDMGQAGKYFWQFPVSFK